MLIIVPSSEGKRVPTTGAPLDPAGLGFPALAPLRDRVLAALIATSGRPDAREWLGVGASLEGEIARNRSLRSHPAAAAIELYDGVLHRALDAGSLDARGRRRTDRSLVIASALFGLLRPSDPIPPYRLPVTARLVGLERLETLWRDGLAAVLAATSGVILDLRAASYRALGPTEGERTVTIRLVDGVPGGNVALKRARGLAARRLLEAPTEPTSIEELGALLGAVALVPPARRGDCWTLLVDPRTGA